MHTNPSRNRIEYSLDLSARPVRHMTQASVGDASMLSPRRQFGALTESGVRRCVEEVGVTWASGNGTTGISVTMATTSSVPLRTEPGFFTDHRRDDPGASLRSR